MLKSRRLKCGGHVACMGEMTVQYRRHKCEYNIEINLEELGWKNVGWIHLAEARGQW